MSSRLAMKYHTAPMRSHDSMNKTNTQAKPHIELHSSAQGPSKITTLLFFEDQQSAQTSLVIYTNSSSRATGNHKHEPQLLILTQVPILRISVLRPHLLVSPRWPLILPPTSIPNGGYSTSEKPFQGDHQLSGDAP